MVSGPSVVDSGIMTTRCMDCGRPIRWVVVRGSPVAIDPDPVRVLVTHGRDGIPIAPADLTGWVRHLGRCRAQTGAGVTA